MKSTTKGKMKSTTMTWQRGNSAKVGRVGGCEVAAAQRSRRVGLACRLPQTILATVWVAVRELTACGSVLLLSRYLAHSFLEGWMISRGNLLVQCEALRVWPGSRGRWKNMVKLDKVLRLTARLWNEVPTRLLRSAGHLVAGRGQPGPFFFEGWMISRGEPRGSVRSGACLAGLLARCAGLVQASRHASRG